MTCPVLTRLAFYMNLTAEYLETLTRESCSQDEGAVFLRSKRFGSLVTFVTIGKCSCWCCYEGSGVTENSSFDMIFHKRLSML